MDSHLPRSQSVDASLAQRAQPWNPHLNLSGAAISGGGTAAGDDERLVPTILLPNQSADVSHFAIDIGGSLIKLVYFSRALSDPMRLATVGGLRSPYPKGGVSSPPLGKHREKRDSVGMDGAADAEGAAGLSGGRLHFVKFETAKLQEFIDFVFSKKLHLCRALGDAVEESLWGYGEGEGVRVKATGGGAYKYADILKEKLHLTLDKVDEMSCLVSGANFLLKTVEDEAFTYIGGVKEFVRINPKSLFPYLLVNIGSGVSMVKVDGDGEGQYERVSGTNIGGGTFWGLCRLLTKCKSFDEMLALSAQGDNSKVDMLVGDIYGGMDYAKVGLSADTIASSFGKVVMEGKDLSDFRPADLALSLVRMVSYNIAQLSYLVAMQYGLRRIILGGFFIRGHLYTMDTMSYAIKFWSKGSMNAHFLRHEGYLGALGAFLKYDNSYVTGLQRNWSFQWVERFPAASVFCAENVSGAAAESNTDAGASSNGTPRSSVPAGELVHDANRPAEASKSWVEKFVEVGSSHLGTGRNGEATPFIKPRSSLELKGSAAAATSRLAGPDPDLVAAEAEAKSMEGMGSVGLRVGVLHLCPTIARFPLLADMDGYEPNTVDIMQDTAELEYWITVLTQQLPNLVEKAIESEGGTEDAIQRGRAFEFSFRAHLARLRGEPAAYGRLGLAGLLSMREDCLREFHFVDAYKPEKEKESAAALQVFPDLLVELDAMEPEARLLALIEGVLAGNIFDWGARACVQLYKTGTILEMYRETRRNVKRPWLVDDFDAFQETWFSRLSGEDARGMYRRALLFVDNAGADVVLGMLPLAREMLYAGIEVIIVANWKPAINDITVEEMRYVIAEAAKHCHVLRTAAGLGEIVGKPPGCTCGDNGEYETPSASDSEGSVNGQGGAHGHRGGDAGGHPHSRAKQRCLRCGLYSASAPDLAALAHVEEARQGAPSRASSSSVGSVTGGSSRLSHRLGLVTREMAGDVPRLMVVGNGQPGPCLDLGRVSAELALAAENADLVVLEGMGRSLHTNYHAKFLCDSLKLAMIKNRKLAERFNGALYDCVCRFERGSL